MAQIILHDVGIQFPIYGLSAQSLKRKLLRVGTGGVFGKTDKSDQVTIRALRNIHLQLNAGDRLGLIGHNGAGKSTLLRVVSRIYTPTEGRVRITGKVSALLDVMMGLDSESTGHENILIRGLFQGMTRKEINFKRDEIAEFTGLGDYLSMPVRTYSSGMVLRLAFGIATSIMPEILVLDEVIGAGDADFMKKSSQRIESMIQHSKIVVLSSHAVNVLEKNCNLLMVLEAGQIKYYGPTQEGLKQYETGMYQS